MADILIVDDDPLHLSFVAQCVDRAGHQSSVLRDGGQCLAAVERRNPDLVITNICMPAQEGMELIDALKTHWPHLPVIGMAGGCRGTKQPPTEYFQWISSREVLTKPFTAAELFETIDRASGGDPERGAIPRTAAGAHGR